MKNRQLILIIILIIISIFKIKTKEEATEKTKTTARDPCIITSTVLYPFDQFKECIYSVMNNPVTQKEILESLSEYLQLYVFQDIVLNSTTSLTTIEVNITDEIEKIKQENITFDFDLHQKINDFMTRLYDAHTQYYKPYCYSEITFLFPFELMAVVNSSSKENAQENPLVFINSVFSNSTQFATDYNSVTGINPINFIGKQVQEIEGTDAWEYLVQNSDSVYSSKDPSARLNEYLSFDFSMHFLQTLPVPEKSNRTLRIDGNLIDIPFVGYNYLDFSSTDEFISACINGSLTNTQDLNENHKKYSIFQKQQQKNQNPKLKNPILKKKQKIEQLKKQFPKEKQDQKQKTNGAEIQTIFSVNNEVGLSTLILNNQVQAGILHIISFAPQNENAFKANIEKSIEYLESNEIGNLIIDLRSNSGGYIPLGYETFHFLFNDSKPPLYGNYDFIHSYLNDEMFEKCSKNQDCVNSQDNTYSPKSWWNPQEQQYQDISWYSPGVVLERGNVFSNYSNFIHDIADLSWINNFKFFDKNHTSILSDGLCGSTCAVFAEKIHSANLAQTFSVGGLPGMDMGFYSFPGGEIYDSDEIDYLIYFFFPDFGITINNMPLLFTSDQSVSFTYREIYPFFGSQQDIPLEFIFNPSDHRILIWDFSNSNDLEIFSQVLQYMPTPTPKPTPSPQSSKPENSKVPLIVGTSVSFFVVIVALFVGFFIYRRKKRIHTHFHFQDEISFSFSDDQAEISDLSQIEQISDHFVNNDDDKQKSSLLNPDQGNEVQNDQKNKN
ncbi:peptidase s41 family protein [Anaeramoeba ignava]|uniref:Peptidase s41 family protein n=1 Tax=Anaeramoeba ignava TaxID=1746090 RepID=A0A9Q0LKE2_ANAIG|nr:peptidase s41 family protein [Anaeramoeba ignava]